VIQFSSGYGVAENFETLGAVSRHPKYFPNMWRSKYRHLSHSESVDELYTEFRLYNEFKGLANDEYDMMQKQFGSDLPDMNTLKRNVQMLFVNVPAIFDNNRPVPPNIQYLGGLHLARPMNTELSYPIKSYLDKCVRGVIYVSFGSAIKTSDIGTEFLNVFIDTFRALPYDILWNTNINISNLPNNVHTHNWLPQRELLHHRNVVGFVTQGGVQSTDESIDALVPLIGVPMMGDQFFNTNRYIELGIGTAVDSLKVTSQKLTDAILSVVHNATILSNLKRLHDVINDQPMKPLQKAIYWTKYILKHRFDSMLVTSTAYKEFYTSCLGSYGNNLFKECE
jgi:glucuronosyltransferase